MRCPSLAELPPPPPGHTGWPWTMESTALPDTQPAGRAWPRISIVTPSFNQGQFIEETIRSVLLQGYPDLEYVIVDGGSTDASVGIIRKYAPWLAHWVSEKDRGQSHALNKGLERVTGPVFGWLNSDDVYQSDAFGRSAALVAGHPGAVGWAGATQAIDAEGRAIEVQLPKPGGMEDLGEWAHKAYIPQPSCLFATARVREAGGINESLYYTMDVALLIQLAGMGAYAITSDILASLRVYEGTKTSQDPVGALVEMIATDFNLGLRGAAENLLRSRMRGAEGGAIDRLTSAERCELLDSVGFRVILRYLVARVWRSLMLRLSRAHHGRGELSQDARDED